MKHSSQKRPHQTTAPGTKSHPRKKDPVPGSGRGKPAKGFDPETNSWK